MVRWPLFCHPLGLAGASYTTWWNSNWEKYQERGAIAPDYTCSEQHHACLQEILSFLDEEVPDQIRFQAMKNLFLNTAMERFSDSNSILPHQYMQVCRVLSSGEILLLRAMYKAVKDNDWDRSVKDIHGWLRDVAARSGLVHTSLVEIHERALMEKGLLTTRRHSDQSGIVFGKYWRLTDLGFELCRFIELPME